MGKEAGLMQFTLNYDNCEDTPVLINYRPALMPSELKIHVGGPANAVYKDGRKYFLSSDSKYLQHNYHNVNVFLVGSDSVARVVASIGQVCEYGLMNEAQADGTTGRYWAALKQPAVTAKMPAKPLNEILYVWADKNANSIMEADEVTFKWFAGNRGRAYMNQDFAYFDISGLYVPPPSFLPNGVPVYDPEKTIFLATVTGTCASELQYVQGAEDPVYTPDGYFIAQSLPIQGFKDGKKVWQYNGSCIQSQPKFPGDVVAMLKVLGPCVIPPQGEAGAVWGMGNDKGSVYLFTSDGLFLFELGGDMRTTPLWRLKTWQKGMMIENVAFEDEMFYPSMTQVNGGSVFAIFGKEHCSIVRLEGFETVKRLEAVQFEVTPQMLEGKNPVLLPITSGPMVEVLQVLMHNSPPAIDGNFGDWGGVKWVKIDNADSAAIMIAGDKLCVGYQTNDPNLLVNGGGQNGNIQTLFKTGGALDLFMATDSINTALPISWRTRSEPAKGDFRLTVTKAGTQTMAALFQPIVPGATADQRIAYMSMIDTVLMDKVTDVSSSIEVAQNGTNYEFSVPLSVIGLAKPTTGLKTMGDIGFLRGQNAQTVERVYWRNKNTAIVSDIPSEARFQPGNWGRFDFKDGVVTGAGERGVHRKGPGGIGVRNFSKGILALDNAGGIGGVVRVTTLDGKTVCRASIHGGSERLALPQAAGANVYIIRFESAGTGSALHLVAVGK
jgi:hypothetical protein